ncbi:MAG: response regulator [Planctomycetaceae bacterium]|nr:response regulator [Planctomycetaceae bacterium]
MIHLPDKHRILVVDDEPDVFTLTRLSLRQVQYRGRGVELVSAMSGAACVESLREHPETSVILLDVVMESEHAGLEACRTIREQLNNKLVRILLRTGQPGTAPEKQAIDEYDIDGYLLKTELTTTRLYAAVRTAIKAHEELVELERHRTLLRYVLDCATEVHSFDGIELALRKTLAAAADLTESTLAVLSLETFASHGDPLRFLLHSSANSSDEATAQTIAHRVQTDSVAQSAVQTIRWADGLLIPLHLHRELGHGWIYLQGGRVDHIVEQVLPVLAAHAANALYAVVAQRLLEDREDPLYSSIGV